MELGQDLNSPAYGLLCDVHFESHPTIIQVWACPSCQKARNDEKERIQAEDTIDPTQPYGQHIKLSCRNHPNLRWSTKNIDYIGARSIFYDSPTQPECECSITELVVVKAD